MTENNKGLPYDVNRAVHDLRDKFKHGHHILKILESQLETARQNISLLQGQVRLANETIENLRQQFNEADTTLSYLVNHHVSSKPRDKEPTTPRHDGNSQFDIRDGDEYKPMTTIKHRSDECESVHKHSGTEADPRSPRPVIVFTKGSETLVTVSSDSISNHSDRPRSPYAQQLRQVLDALQDEDPKRLSMSSHATHDNMSHVAHDNMNSTINQEQPCMCTDCVPVKQYVEVSGYRSDRYGCEYREHSHNECEQHGIKGTPTVPSSRDIHVRHVRKAAISPVARVSKSNPHTSVHEPHVTVSTEYSPHCTAMCCANIDLSKGYKVVEKSPGMAHYIAPRSPRDRSSSSVRKHSYESSGTPSSVIGHCDDKCRCHAFVNYAPYGYQVVESAPGIPQAIQPISPTTASKRNKRHHPVAPGDEPPHLKYTKVKRIDGSKVAAQKTIADFTKRRFHPYNPRWDLDLQIVPPPLAASELMDKLKIFEDNGIPSIPVEIKKEETRVNPAVQPQVIPLDQKSYTTDAIVDIPNTVTGSRSKVINSNGTVIVLSEDDDPSAILKRLEASGYVHDGVSASNLTVTTASIKKETNHNVVDGKKYHQQDQVVVDTNLTSSLMARYEKVMSERNKDFSDFSNDNTITVTGLTHVKGRKVH